MDKEFDYEIELEDSFDHIESDEYQCAKKRYVQIIDVERYINIYAGF